MVRSRYFDSFGVAVLTLIVYLFTIHPVTRVYSFYALVASAMFGFSVVLFKNQDHRLLLYTCLTILLLIVGITGWFFSPFFSWLYVLAIALAFLLDPIASYAFVIVLVGVFFPSVGSIDLRFDMLTLFSLVALIPLTYIMRLEFLRIKESQKKILVLERENNRYESNLEELLSNRVVRMAVELREPVNDIKLVGYHGLKAKNIKEAKKDSGKVILLADKTLQVLKMFEQDVTGKKLTENKK